LAVASERVFWSAHWPKYFLPFATKAALRLFGEAARAVKSVTGAAATKPAMVARRVRYVACMVNGCQGALNGESEMNESANDTSRLSVKSVVS